MTIRDHKQKADFGISRNLGPTAKIMIIYAVILSLADRVMESVFVLLNFVLRLFMQSDAKIFDCIDILSNISLSDMILEPVFVIGLSSVALTLQRGREAHHSQLWEGFKHFFKSFWLYWSCRIISLLWGLLFIVPGIIRYYSYSMAPFIMAEKPGLSVKDARALSRELTNEYKLRIFLLDLSFIGWYMLALAAALILRANTLVAVIFAAVLAYTFLLWATPYMMTARADLYQYIKAQKNLNESMDSQDTTAEKPLEEVEYYPITEEIRQSWQARYQKRKKILLTVCASVLSVAVLISGWCIFRIKVQDKVPAILPDSIAGSVNVDVVREFTGYMWWNDEEYEPEQVTVKLNGYVKDGIYYGTMVVLGEKGVLYDFGDVQYIRYVSAQPMIMFPDRSKNLNAIEYHLSYTYMDNRSREIIISTGKNMWNTSYQYIGENYKTEQYSNKLHQINIFAPADSYESAIERYNEILGLTEGQKMTISYSSKD